MDVDGTDTERKLSGDRSWIAKNGLTPERLWGRRNVNHGRGVLSRRLVRENLVMESCAIRWMIISGWALNLKATLSDS